MKHFIKSKSIPNATYVVDDETEDITVSDSIKITISMAKKEKDDLPHNVSRFSVTQVQDFSFSDGANIEAVKLGKKAIPKAKTVIENTKPEL